MRCPKCGEQEDKVIDSRASKEGSVIRRRRECLACGHRFTTYEEVEVEPLMVIKRDGRREPFSRDKLSQSFQRACQKRSVSEDDIARAVDRIQEELRDEFERELPATEVGTRVMRELRALDQVAYVRFASIYRNFAEVADFVQEVHRLEQEPPPDQRQLAFELNPDRKEVLNGKAKE